ncbi:MAG TPA: hypothetical protein PKN44_10160 [Bacteroidales bacterium]|mgnify:CR=1 FL=1|nr:hypothetical protein [Bacteroidales bacterium]
MTEIQENEVKIIKVGEKALAVMPVGVYAFEVSGSMRMASPSVLPFYSNIRQLQPVRIGEFDIVPNGQENNYPDELRVILDDNNLTPEILNKQAQLLYGQGPALYSVRFENGRRIKYWVEDREIQDWLDSWDYEDYLLKGCVEFRTTNGRFTKFYRNKGARIGARAVVAKLEHVSSMYSRLEWPDVNNQVHNIIVGDYSQPWKNGLRRYPVFNPDTPFDYPVSMRYSNLYSFALDYEYSRSPLHGNLNWIKLHSSIPKLLQSFNDNSMAIKYHIEVPAIYWENLKSTLQDKYATEGKEFTDKVFEDAKDEVMKKFSIALAGGDKVGKFVSTSTVFDEIGNQYVGWKITPLDQKVKDFIDAQINIANEALFQTTSGIGLHPALSNLSKDGNLPSGSEQLYAFKLYLQTGVEIPEGIVMKDINMAIRANFPKKKLRLGFYHDVLLTEESTNPKDRIRNQSSGPQNTSPNDLQ